MSDIRTKAVEGVVEVSESALRRMEADPKLKSVLEKAGVEMTEAGTARITAQSPEAAARLERAAEAVGVEPAPPTPTLSPEPGVIPPAATTTPAPTDTSPIKPDGTGGALPASTAGGPAGFGTSSLDETARGLSVPAKLGIGAAGIGAAGYAATRDPESPAPTTPKADTAAPTTSGSVSTSVATSDASAAPRAAADDRPAPTPAQAAPTVAAAHVVAAKLKKDPAYLSDVLKETDDQIGGLRKQKTDWTAADDKKWASDKAAIRDIAREAQRTNQWAEVAERIGQAVVQMGAAMSGLRTGVDMSGLKFDKTDWKARNDQLIQNLQQDLGLVSDEETANRTRVTSAKAALDKLMASRRDTLEKKGERNFDVDSKNAGFEQQANEGNARNQQSASEANARLQAGADELNFRASEGALDRDSRERAEAGREEARREMESLKTTIKTETDANKARTAILSYSQGIRGLAKLPSSKRAVMEQQLRKEAATAGIGPSTYQQIMDEAEKQDGWFSGQDKYEYAAAKFEKLADGVAPTTTTTSTTTTATSRGAAAPGTASKTPPGKVAVRAKADGQTYYLDPAAAQAAIKAGDAEAQ
jgi:hypothetical protein